MPRVHRYFNWDWMKRFIFFMFQSNYLRIVLLLRLVHSFVLVFFIHETFRLFFLWQFVNSQWCYRYYGGNEFYFLFSCCCCWVRFDFLLSINKKKIIWSMKIITHSTQTNHSLLTSRLRTHLFNCDNFSFPWMTFYESVHKKTNIKHDIFALCKILVFFFL